MPKRKKPAEVKVTFTQNGQGDGKEKLKRFFGALAMYELRRYFNHQSGKWRKKPRKRKLTPPRD